MTTELISCQGLSKSYGSLHALDGVDLTVGRGQIIGLLGPNGAGKTTLIKILCGLLRPTQGSVTINGSAIGVDTKGVVSYLPDKMYFADWMKAKDLLNLFGDFYEDFSMERAQSMCESLSIDENQKIKAMSKGTKEKLQLILAMSRQAQLYLLDEPIAGVDPAARDYIMNTILTNYNQNGTVIISTHLIDDIERILDEVILLQNGKILRHQNVDDIRASEGKSVDQYFRDLFRAGGDGNVM